ncbi:MAG: acetylxylan esterase [Streptococcus parasanguinis]
MRSGGYPRYIQLTGCEYRRLPEAAVDYLATHDQVDADRIGIIGICGWGGIALNAAAIDPRIKRDYCINHV